MIGGAGFCPSTVLLVTLVEIRDQQDISIETSRVFAQAVVCWGKGFSPRRWWWEPLKELSKWKVHSTGVFWLLFSFLGILITGLLPFFFRPNATIELWWNTMRCLRMTSPQQHSTAIWMNGNVPRLLPSQDIVRVGIQRVSTTGDSDHWTWRRPHFVGTCGGNECPSALSVPRRKLVSHKRSQGRKRM